MRLSRGQKLYKKDVHYNNINTNIFINQRSLPLRVQYKKNEFLLIDINALTEFDAALEGWSGTTWPLQLRQPGSTPGPFAIICQYRLIGGKSLGH